MLDSRLYPRTDDASKNTTSVDPNEEAANYCCSHCMSITQVSAYGWLVRREPRVGKFDGILGCVEQRNESFEVMEIGGGFRWTTFTALLDVVTHLASRAESGSTRLVSA
ncbi:hypothetical protein [Cryobacterium sp. Y57]|uniref:hypothetical protein n=1 Tax=Cryobacterium sp. Y57 TaxID=2048287 RepID=UPI001304F6F1|nr:hypothetical protein [Cryobacterium sp. Y57]